MSGFAGESKEPLLSAKPLLSAANLASLITPPYLIAFGHSSYAGCGQDVELLGEQYLVTYTQHCSLDEIALGMTYIKEHGKLPAADLAADQKLCVSTDTTPNYTFTFHDDNRAGTAAGFGMGVYIADGSTLQPVQPSLLAEVQLDVTAEKGKGEITVVELLRLARSLKIHSVVGLGCKRGNVQFVPEVPVRLC